jgi:competence protein ComEC
VKSFPALRAAIVASLGVVIGRECPQYQIFFLCIGLSSVVTILIWFIVRRREISLTVSSGLYVALASAFAFSMSTDVTSLSSAQLSNYNYFYGTVEDSPRDSAASSSIVVGNCFGLVGYGRANANSFARWHKINGEIVLTPSCGIRLNSGDKIIFRGKVGNLSRARNPGDFNLKSYYQLNGIAGRVYINGSEDVLCISRLNRFDFKRDVVERLRNYMRGKVKTFMTGEEAELARAMVIGERLGISKELNEQFINTGTVHILAVSGLHVGFFTGILMIIASLLRIPRKVRFFSIAPVLILYAMVVGMTPSVTRAVIMALVFLFGHFLQRQSQILNSLGFAALLILAFSPSQLFAPGFQLSFVAVLSIALLHQRILGVLRSSYPSLRDNPYLNSMLSFALLTVSATIGTVPLTTYYFHRVSLVSVFANFLIVPLAGLFISMVFASLFIGIFLPGLAALYGSVAQVFGHAIIQLNVLIGKMRISHIAINDVQWSFAFLYFLWFFLVAAFANGGPSPRRKVLWGKIIFSILLGANLILYANIFGVKHEAKLFVLDVGQGDAILVQLPDGKNMLVDSGLKFRNYDIGERVIVPFLKRNGVEKIDYFVITHLHSDHIGGAVSVIRNVRVDNFIYPEQFSRSAAWAKTVAFVSQLKIPARSIRAGVILDSASTCRVYVLHPNRKYVGEGGLAYKARFNDGSIVLKVCIGEKSFLLVGDIGKRVEHDLVRVYGNFLASDVYKAGHHGSNTSSSIEFLKVVHPSYAVISVGANNKFGHPSPEVISEMKKENIKIWRTDSLGAAYFRVSTGTFRLVQWN